jgi:hypothetical protein
MGRVNKKIHQMVDFFFLPPSINENRIQQPILVTSVPDMEHLRTLEHGQMSL